MRNIDEVHEAHKYLLQARPIVDVANERLKYMFSSPKGGHISQESRNKARKRNRKRK